MITKERLVRYPSIINMTPEWVDNLDKVQTDAGDDKEPIWVPARPLGFASFWYRCKAAWLVFTGRADALKWPFQ